MLHYGTSQIVTSYNVVPKHCRCCGYLAITMNDVTLQVLYSNSQLLCLMLSGGVCSLFNSIIVKVPTVQAKHKSLSPYYPQHVVITCDLLLQHEFAD